MGMKRDDSIAAVIPAYNEESSIFSVVKDASHFVDEVVVIDDGSGDRTVELAAQAGAKVICHPSNLGIGSSLKTGYKYCLSRGYDLVVQLDADGQHDPRHIPQMVDYLVNNGKDIVTGSRFLEHRAPTSVPIRRIGIRFFSAVGSLLGSTRITDVTSGYRVYKSSALRLLWNVDDRHWAIGQTLQAVSLGLRYGEIPIQMQNRTQGSSQFDARTMILYPLRMSRVILKTAVSGSSNRHRLYRDLKGLQIGSSSPEKLVRDKREF
jgi:glycosyltransferase involved in cell wall biosynthesis